MTAAAFRPCAARCGARSGALRRRLLAAAAALGLSPAAAAAQDAANRDIRVGLADGVPAARLSAAAPFQLRAGELAIETAWVLIAPETGPAEPALALGSFDGEEGAEDAAESYRAAAGTGGGASVRVRRNPADGRYLAVLPSARGEPPAAVVRRLRDGGFPGAGLFDIPEPVGDALVLRPVGGSPIRIPGGVALTAAPPASGFLEWEGRPYRGSLTVFRSGAGVTVVNRLPLEDYLLGVVPRELPPDLFPELEALKAQALAARTYALRPRDAYLERGYDLCSGPACQVYGGVGAERPLSSRAVRETAGEALFHDGALIDALYTAACGGATENAENIFTTKTPYLVSRACIRDSGGLRLETSGAAPLDAALVRAADLLPAGWADADALAAPAGAAESERLLRETARRLGAPVCDLPDAPRGDAPLTLGAFAESVRALRCRPAPSEGAAGASAVSPFGPGTGEMPPAVRALLDEGLLDAGERGLAPDRPVSRREVLFAAAALLRREAPSFRRGQVRGIEGGALLVEEDGETPRGGPSPGPSADRPLLRLTPAGRPPAEAEAWLYRETSSRRIPGRGDPAPAAAPVRSLTARLGDFVRFLAPGPGGGSPAADGEAPPLRFEALILEDLGATWDRFSRQRSWLVPKDAASLAEAAARRRPIGDLLALEPLEYGASGRIVRLRLVGSEGSLEVRGLGVRRLLGLSDNLFFAEPRRDPDGRLTGYWFTGRGWGHGLGLCQAGAYGMAAAGADYREILTHYYAGVEIRR